MKKTLNGEVWTTTATPLSSSPPGTVKMAANATVAKRTATTVTELVALLMPSRWSLRSSLAMPFTLRFVLRACSSWVWTSFLISETVLRSSSRDKGRDSAMSRAVLWSRFRAFTVYFYLKLELSSLICWCLEHNQISHKWEHNNNITYLKTLFPCSYVQSGVAEFVWEHHNGGICLQKQLHHRTINTLDSHVESRLAFLVHSSGQLRILLQQCSYDVSVALPGR
ncbi:basic helix-loop-helix (bHLH) DNA-bindingsuperfamily protein [Striga asiatica]|uniref:Basic helix-loop-helix (BHLH) DNA-bindingsuperfamily protein n=1 Tax=Striga asiatica TaxID=4170 RepID=A0A5A7RJE6_STRAF|nr:basic helix-loop-helix (bHLH) DNA-bindingsuperfamily protein [Striga asiatica]